MNTPTTSSANNSAATSTAVSPGTRRDRRARWPLWVLGIAMFALAGTFYYANTLVVGTEINSHTWQIRNFSFRRDPFTNSQITGIRYEPAKRISNTWIAQNELCSAVSPAIKVHLTAQTNQPERWDLVQLTDRFETLGRGAILVRLVDANGFAASNFWVDWSNNETNKAAVLWPAAQQLVILGLYANLPDLFEYAIVEKDDASFQINVAQIMLSALHEHAVHLALRGERSAAVEAAKIGLTYGDHAELLSIVEPE